MPWIALVPDISGVCSIVGTFEITSKPTNTASTKIVISVIRSPLMRATAPSIRFPDALVDDPAVVRDAAPAVISSSKSRLELALGRQVREQVGDVVRVQQARVVRHLARQVERAVDRHAVRARRPGRARSARSCRRSRRRCRRSPSPGRIARTISSRDELRRRPAGNGRGRDHAVGRGDALGEQLALAALRLLGQLLRVLAGARALALLLAPRSGRTWRRGSRPPPSPRAARRRPRPRRRGASPSRSPAGPRRRRPAPARAPARRCRRR